MEDAATAEISRSQVWQWIRHHVSVKEGIRASPELVRQIVEEELSKIRQVIGVETYAKGRFNEARAIFELVAVDDAFIEFLTIPAYEYID